MTPAIKLDATAKAATRALLMEITDTSGEAEIMAVDPNEIAAAGILNHILLKLILKD